MDASQSGSAVKILKTGYRGFLELLWNRGIPADALSDEVKGTGSALEPGQN